MADESRPLRVFGDGAGGSGRLAKDPANEFTAGKFRTAACAGLE